MILEIEAEGWVLIIGAIGSMATVVGAALVGVIMALKSTNAKLDEAAVRREEIAEVSPPHLVPPERPVRRTRPTGGRRP